MALATAASMVEQLRLLGLPVERVWGVISAGDSGEGHEVVLAQRKNGSLCEVSLLPGGKLLVVEGW